MKKIIILLLLLLVTQTAATMSVKSPGSDEMTYIEAGYRYWTTGDFRYNQEHPPLPKLIAALPILANGVPSPEPYNVFFSRLMIVGFSVLLGVFVYKWANELYGYKSGLFALALYVFSPNILAWSGMVIPSLPVACFSFISLYYFWKYIEAGELKYIFPLSLATAMAFLSDFTSLILVPVYAVFIFIKIYEGWRPGFAVQSVFIFISIILITMTTVYGFSFSTINDQVFDKSRIENFPSYILDIPIPLTPYFSGLYYQVVHTETGHQAFLMGSFSEGWWYYYPFAFVLKTSIFFLSLIVLTAVVFINKIKKNELYILLPVAALFTFFALIKIDTGIRHILLVYPLLFVFASRLVNAKKILALLLLLFFMLSSFAIHPHYISYFNEAVGPDNGYEYLLDSNIDFDQDRYLLQIYEEKQGVVFGEPVCHKEKGLFAIRVNYLMGLVPEKRGCYDWLQAYQPYNKIGYSIFLYNISQ